MQLNDKIQLKNTIKGIKSCNNYNYKIPTTVSFNYTF